MKVSTTAPSAHSAAKLTTAEFAELLRIAPQTARASLCHSGHYLGIKPIKLPNGKLLWDSAEVERLLSDGGAR